MKLKHVSGNRYEIDKEKTRTRSVRQMRVYANMSQPDSPCAARKKLKYCCPKTQALRIDINA